MRCNCNCKVAAQVKGRPFAAINRLAPYLHLWKFLGPRRQQSLQVSSKNTFLPPVTSHSCNRKSRPNSNSNTSFPPTNQLNMVFLPDRPHNPLKGEMSSWEQWRDGAPIDCALPKPPPPQFACQINSDFTSRDGFNIKYRKGMQGHFLEERTHENMRMGRIFIQGVTPHGPKPEDQNAWVPLSQLTKGAQWKDDINDWNFDISLLPHNVRLPQVPSTTNDKLARTITALLQGFLDNPTPTTASYSDCVLREGVETVSSLIQQGIRDAGVYDILAQTDCNSAALSSAATCHIDGTHGRGKKGIYARFLTSKANVQYWKPNTRFVSSH